LEWVDILQGGVGLPSPKGSAIFNFYLKGQEKTRGLPCFLFDFLLYFLLMGLYAASLISSYL